MSFINQQMNSGSFSMGDFVWWLGVVEDRKDPEELGRVRVRIFGYHTEDKKLIKTEDLFWATVVQPITSAFLGGIGTSPTGLVEGSNVIGFFIDGHNAQNPVILGSIGGKPWEKSKGKGKKKGFLDPNEIYPRYEENEQDTNRLARNKKPEKTTVKWRKDRVDTAPKAFGGTWTEPKTPYAAKYPFNHVRESEPKPEEDVSKKDPPKNCGHIEEWDDTPGKERLYRQHKAGTFEEIHPDGTTVDKIVKDRYTVVERNEHLHVLGEGKVTIAGNNYLLIQGTAYIEIAGNCQEYIHGNYNLRVGGNMDVNVAGHLYEKSGVHMKLEAPRIDLNPEG